MLTMDTNNRNENQSPSLFEDLKEGLEQAIDNVNASSGKEAAIEEKGVLIYVNGEPKRIPKFLEGEELPEGY